MGNQGKFSGLIVRASIYAKNQGTGPWEYSVQWKEADTAIGYPIQWTGEFSTWQEALDALRTRMEAEDAP